MEPKTESDAQKLVYFCHPHLQMLKCPDATPPPCSGHNLKPLPWTYIDRMPWTSMPIFINHPAHPSHNLELGFHISGSFTCESCRLEITEGFFYRCNNFRLNVVCASLPPSIMNHPSHPDYPLSLLLQTPATFCCDGCDLPSSCKRYHCHQCNFDVHVICPFNHQLLPQAPTNINTCNDVGDYGTTREGIFSCILKGVVDVAVQGGIHVIENL